jgi:hypothetical protein
MASYGIRLEFQVTDINGNVAQTSFPLYLTDTHTLANIATVIATLEADLAALTNGKVTKQGFSVFVNEAQYLVGTAPPNNAEYSSVTDGAKLSFANGNGQRMSVTIPAPIEAVFGATSNVVDSTVTAVATFITDVEANCNAIGGAQFNLYKGGVKVGRHSRKRVSKLVP